MLLSVLGIFFLYFLSTFSQPNIIELYEIPEYEGKQVIVEGIVTEHYTTSYGSQIIEIKSGTIEDNSTVVIFVEKETNVEYGDTIQATGEVQKYKGEWEVVVSDERFVKTVQKWQDIIMPLWQLAGNPDRYIGMNVNVTGIVDRTYDTYFYLLDSDEARSIVVFYNPSAYHIYEGNRVYVAGKFVYDEDNLRYVLQVDEEIHNISVAGGK